MKKQTTRARPRPATRRRSKRRWTRLARSIRIFFTLTVVASVVLCMGAIITKVAKPYLIDYGESRQIAKIKKETAETADENRALKRAITHLSTPEGMEAEARKLGWVKQGETPLVIERPEESEREQGRSVDSPARETFWCAAGRGILKLFVRPDSTD